MPYVTETFDKPESLPLRKQVRPEHLDFLAANAQLLLACGAKLTDEGTDLGGGVYVVDTELRNEAQAFIEADPFFKAGLFEQIRITRWRKAYIGGGCYL